MVKYVITQEITSRFVAKMTSSHAPPTRDSVRRHVRIEQMPVPDSITV